jgi:hypothetical protein
MCAYRRPIHTFSEVTAMKIRYQQLEISDGQARKFADVVFHDLSPDEYNLSLEQVINSLQPCSASYWISKIEINNQVLSCNATAKYHDIRRFKALEERQTKAAASENAVVVTHNDLAYISSVDDVIRVAMKICPGYTAKSEAEYHPTFEYHVVEDAILNANGWECLRKVEDRYIPIEDDKWVLTRKERVFRQFPWMSAFNPIQSLLEYGLKLLTLAQDVKEESVELRQKMLTKALQGRTSLAVNGRTDFGHAFCIAVLLIAIYQCRHE